MQSGKSPGLGSERMLPLRTYLRTLRDAPKALRARFAGRLFPELFRTSVKSEPESCEFDSLEDYETKYRLLARLLDRPEKTPPPDELVFLRSLQDCAGRAGTISV